MGILSDREIAEEVAARQMIDPYLPWQVRMVPAMGGVRRVISYGQSSYGYDMRCSANWRIFTNAFGEIVDPKAFAARAFVESTEQVCIIPPNSFVLTSSVEYFRMPTDVIGICLGKSTYARCGIVCNVTPLEPGWEGQLTIELSNTTPLPVRVYANEGIAQILFFRGRPCATSYSDRGGKYQGTRGIVSAKL